MFACFAGMSFAGAQSVLPETVGTRKGLTYLSWGYNRSQYTHSDIRMVGTGYDYTLHGVSATDRPSSFSPDIYFNPKQLSIPQFNIRAGYFFKDKWALTMGYDHMKYVVRQYQQVRITGVIEAQASPNYEGEYEGDPILINPDFLMYEHTDGLNYLSAELDYYERWWASSRGKFVLSGQLGFGAGLLVPRSDVSAFGEPGANVFHVAGWGVDAHGGIRLDMGRYFFFQLSLKGGFMDMNDVLTYRRSGYKAVQHFFFLEQYASLGFQLHLPTVFKSLQ